MPWGYYAVSHVTVCLRVLVEMWSCSWTVLQGLPNRLSCPCPGSWHLTSETEANQAALALRRMPVQLFWK